MRYRFVTLVLAFFLAAPAFAAPTGKTIPLAPRDKCAVCGMFVAKFPNFAARITYGDGSYAVFDGCKDMFTYYLNMKKYAAGKSRKEIAALSVTDYYSLGPIDGFSAYYVIGSNVAGPMGNELIPFARLADAEEFRRDHHGKQVLTFTQVSPSVIDKLE